jgi:hypothetical protein
MSGPFNPLAGDFRTTGWLAPDDDYNLKIVKVEYKKIGNDDPKPVLVFSLAIADGPFDGKRPPALQVWEPENDYSQAGRVVMAARGYIPGKEDGRFAEENSDFDLTLDATDIDNLKLGAGYSELVGAVFTAYVAQVPSKKDDKVYQQYKNIRPLGA